MILQCWKSSIDKEIYRIDGIIDELSLDNIQKRILKERYTQVIYNMFKRTQKYSRIYYIGHFIITVGSLFVPALLSVQYSDTLSNSENNTQNNQLNIFWSTWIISLLVTIFNGVLTLYRVDKKYYLLSTTLERLRTEGWQYFSLTGRYSGHLINHMLPTHTNQFIYFCYAIEKIYLKCIAEEFFKNADKKDDTMINNSSNMNSITEQSKNNYSVSNEMFIPSPDKEVNNLDKKDVKDVVKSIIRSSTTLHNISKSRPNSIDLRKEKQKDTQKDNNNENYKNEKEKHESIYIDNLSHYTFDTDNMTEQSDETYKKENDVLENEIILIDK